MRRYPSTIGGALLPRRAGRVAVGLGITGARDWRLGMRWIAASLLVAAALRLVLPDRDAGMLAVRRRSIDVLMLAWPASALIVLP